MTQQKKDALGIALRVTAALALFITAIINYDSLSNLEVEKILASFNNTALISAVALFMYFAKGLIFVLPASVLYIAVGIVLPSFSAVAVNLAGIATEITVTYLLGRFLGGEYVNKFLSGKKAGRKILEADFQNRKWLIFVTRLLPVFPIDFLSLFFGAAKSKFITYFFLSFFGLAPRVILFTVIGDNLFKWIPMDKLIFIVICCIPVGIAVYLMKKLVIDKNKNGGN